MKRENGMKKGRWVEKAEIGGKGNRMEREHTDVSAAPP